VGDDRAPTGNHERQTVVIRPTVDMVDPDATTTRRRLPSLPRPTHAIVAAVTLVAVVGGAAFVASTRSNLEVAGIVDGQRITRRDLATVTLRVTSAGAGAGDVGVEVNGQTVAVTEDGDDFVVSAAALGEAIVEGENSLVVSRHGRLGIGGSTVERTFTYDPVGPLLMVPAAVVGTTPARPSFVRGLVDGAVALSANGQPVTLEPGGAFTVPVALGATSIALVATDVEGNPTEVLIRIAAEPPPTEHPPTAAVHVTARSWADPAVRGPILELARSGSINAVQLDIKDESGEVGYATAVPLATTAGAARAHYDAVATLDELHDLGVRVIGRIVCFLDPVLASWAWENDRAEMVVQQGSGGPLETDYGAAAFTNVADSQVRQYLIDLSVEAAALGFDEILYDYARRPEGDSSAMYFPGLVGQPAVAVARFVAEANARLAGSDAWLGVSVLGISATRPERTAQDIRLIAPHVDYVSPMVYPSHWGPGEYDVDDPVRQPADIVRASITDFQHVVAGSGAAVVPWLQDFSAGGVRYGPVEVRAQIDAALAAGAGGFLLWNSGSFYTAQALDPAVLASGT
jgi:hypothetical protein